VSPDFPSNSGRCDGRSSPPARGEADDHFFFTIFVVSVPVVLLVTVRVPLFGNSATNPCVMDAHPTSLGTVPSIQVSIVSTTTFVQSFGTTHLDASLLIIPMVGFLPPDDPRVKGTVAAVEKHLLRDGFVMRYDTASGEDGLPPGEGAFLPCTFWLADNYALAGDFDKARALFDRLTGLCNDVGLISE